MNFLRWYSTKWTIRSPPAKLNAARVTSRADRTITSKSLRILWNFSIQTGRRAMANIFFASRRETHYARGFLRGHGNVASINPHESASSEMAFHRQIGRRAIPRAKRASHTSHSAFNWVSFRLAAIVTRANRISVSIIIKQRHARRLPIYIYRRDQISRDNISASNPFK